MLKLLRKGATGFETLTPAAGWKPPADAVWLDLVRPSREEELTVETALVLSLPTREEMSEIEPSSRLYQENGATYMTASLLARREDRRADAPVTFVLAKGVLVTIRYDDLRAFSLFAERAPGLGVTSGTMALLGLLDAVVERLADLLEQADA